MRGCLLTVVCTAAGCVVGCGNPLPGALLPDAPRRARGSAAERAAAIPEQKIGIFVRLYPQKPSFSGLLSTKSAFLCSGRRRMALESVTAETLTVNVAFLQITEHAYKMQIPHNQIINF